MYVLQYQKLNLWIPFKMYSSLKVWIPQTLSSIYRIKTLGWTPLQTKKLILNPDRIKNALIFCFFNKKRNNHKSASFYTNI